MGIIETHRKWRTAIFDHRKSRSGFALGAHVPVSSPLGGVASRLCQNLRSYEPGSHRVQGLIPLQRKAESLSLDPRALPSNSGTILFHAFVPLIPTPPTLPVSRATPDLLLRPLGSGECFRNHTKPPPPFVKLFWTRETRVSVTQRITEFPT